MPVTMKIIENNNMYLIIRLLVPRLAWALALYFIREKRGAIALVRTINPADISSRGTAPAALSESMWFLGPEWLKTCNEIEQRQRISGMKGETPPEILQEKKAKDRIQCLASTSLIMTLPSQMVSSVIDCKKFSWLTKPLTVTALVLQCIKKLKSKKKEGTPVRVECSANDISGGVYMIPVRVHPGSHL